MTNGASVSPGAVRPDRLRRSEDVRRVLRRGRSAAGEQLALHVAERPEGTTRMTVVASKRVGDAVRRNRAKRLLREAARTRRWRPGLDVVLVARAACAGSDVHRVGAELDGLARRLGAVEGGR